METQAMPQMSISKIGKKYKILQVTGEKGTQMPSHFCTKEAIILVQEGVAVLKLTAKEIHLKRNDSAIIPAEEPHALMIQENFQAIVIMEIGSEIKFVNN